MEENDLDETILKAIKNLSELEKETASCKEKIQNDLEKLAQNAEENDVNEALSLAQDKLDKLHEKETHLKENIRKSLGKSAQNIEGMGTNGNTAAFVAKLEVPEKQAEEMRNLGRYHESQQTSKHQFEELLLNYKNKKADILEKIQQLENNKHYIKSEIAKQNRQEKSCKETSLYTDLISLAGVLAAGFSAGTSLVLTAGCAVTDFHGYLTVKESVEVLQRRISSTVEECSCIHKTILKLLEELYEIITKMEDIAHMAPEFSRKVINVNWNDTHGSATVNPTLQLTEKVFIPVKGALNLFSREKNVCVTFIKTEQSFQVAISSITIAKDLSTTTVRMSSLTATTRSSIVVVKETLNGARMLTGKSVAMKLVRSSMVVKTTRAPKLALNGGLQVKKTCTIVRGHRVKQTASVTAKGTNSISKLNLALSAVSIGIDLYSLLSHEEPRKSQAEETIDEVIRECQNSLRETDEFVSEARKNMEQIN